MTSTGPLLREAGRQAARGSSYLLWPVSGTVQVNTLLRALPDGLNTFKTDPLQTFRTSSTHVWGDESSTWPQPDSDMAASDGKNSDSDSKSLLGWHWSNTGLVHLHLEMIRLDLTWLKQALALLKPESLLSGVRDEGCLLLPQFWVGCLVAPVVQLRLTRWRRKRWWWHDGIWTDTTRTCTLYSSLDNPLYRYRSSYHHHDTPSKYTMMTSPVYKSRNTTLHVSEHLTSGGKLIGLKGLILNTLNRLMVVSAQVREWPR